MDDQHYERRYAAALIELRDAGLRSCLAEPGYVRLARKLGLKPRPPFYLRVRQFVWVCALYFAVPWGLLMYLVIWRFSTVSVLVDCAFALGTGLLWACLVAPSLHRTTRAKHKLSEWERLDGSSAGHVFEGVRPEFGSQ